MTHQTCKTCGVIFNNSTPHTCITDKPVQFQVLHNDWAYDIKVSNDNTKGEKRVTVHVRSDEDPKKAQKLAHDLYAEELAK